MSNTSIAVKKKVGIVMFIGKLGVSRACPWRLHGRFSLAVCDCGSIRLDRRSSACQVVEFVGVCAATLRMSWSVYFLLIIYFCDLRIAHSGRNMSSV